MHKYIVLAVTFFGTLSQDRWNHPSHFEHSTMNKLLTVSQCFPPKLIIWTTFLRPLCTLQFRPSNASTEYNPLVSGYCFKSSDCAWSMCSSVSQESSVWFVSSSKPFVCGWYALVTDFLIPSSLQISSLTFATNSLPWSDNNLAGAPHLQKTYVGYYLL